MGSEGFELSLLRNDFYLYQLAKYTTLFYYQIIRFR